ncbi:MAG: hemerythrin family protein [Burkholderiales bacterium]|nr:hemerythrin family protein [Burkholderiales bacterium]
MELIQWNDRLKLGIEVVDRQHERLVEIINRLNEAMTQGRGADVIGEILDELIIYTATHFSMEEKYFAQFDYADAAEHKLEHDALIEKVTAFADDLEKAQGSVRSALATELLQFLGIWWRYHMMDTDSKFVALFKERGLT